MTTFEKFQCNLQGDRKNFLEELLAIENQALARFKHDSEGMLVSTCFPLGVKEAWIEPHKRD
jgi:hypothetical protein